MLLLFKNISTLIRRSLWSTYKDGCLGTAKAAAYSSILCFFPLLATTATILVEFEAEFVAQAIQNFLSEILPPGTQDLVFYYFAIKGTQPVILPVTGMIVSIWGASGVMVSLFEGFQKAYRIPSGRPFWRQRMVAVLLVFSAAIPVLAASLMILFGGHIQHWILGRLGVGPAQQELRGGLAVLGAIARYLVSLGSIILGATILYYVGPNRPQKWKRVWPGAVFATIMWLGATSAFAWYVQNLAQYNVLYGSIAAVIALLVWMYFLAIIAFIGCEFNSEYEKAIPEAAR